jgi:hypothetical protein
MLPGEATAFRIECDARAMSALGQSRQIDTAPGSRHVRFAPQSGHRELVSTADEIIRFTRSSRWRSPCTLGSGSSPPLAIVLHPVGREAERSELKRAFCSSLSEL